MGMSGRYIIYFLRSGDTQTKILQNYNNPQEQCSQQDVINFLNVTQSFMDKTNWVERYAWFGAMKDMQGVNEVSSCAQYGVNLLD